MNYRAKQHEQENRRTIRGMWLALCGFLGLLIWGVIRTNGDAAIMGLILSALMYWVLHVYQQARSDEAAILSALAKFGFLTHNEIVHRVVPEVRPADVLPALSRLEDRGLLIGRDDPQLGRMWAVAGTTEVPV